eukprot:scaffold219861_cov27-Tisochrysis_lutea.AAC.1
MRTGRGRTQVMRKRTRKSRAAACERRAGLRTAIWPPPKAPIPEPMLRGRAAARARFPICEWVKAETNDGGICDGDGAGNSGRQVGTPERRLSAHPEH